MFRSRNKASAAVEEDSKLKPLNASSKNSGPVKLSDILVDKKEPTAASNNGPPKAKGFIPPGGSDIKNRIKAAKAPTKQTSIEQPEMNKAVEPSKRLFVSSGASKFKILYKEGEQPSGKLPDGVQDYEKIKPDCLAKGILFEDPEFPAKDSSLFYSEAGRINGVTWKRPSELVDNPRFFVGGASRFDVNQGELGNCWFLAAVASLTMQEKLFYQVVPKDNSFIKDYAGIFHFRFWQYGQWVDIVVDDLLPTNSSGQLLFMHSAEANEFWSALLEKAYAKLNGSYQALTGGLATEALQDFSGGIIEIIDDIKNTKLNVYEIMQKAQARQSFMGCSLKPDAKEKEAKTSDGLVRGHAYSITRVEKVDVNLNGKQGKIPLVRIRNPWGNEFEWKGAWGDNSREWTLVSEEDKAKLGLTFEDDGEFWMSFQDFVKHYDSLEICYLSPDSLLPEDTNASSQGTEAEAAGLTNGDKGFAGKKWNTSYYEGSWIPNATAGGCVNFIHKEPKSYPNNPQYFIEFDEADEDGDPEKCTVLIALMQKNRRAKKKEGVGALSIGFTIYPVKDPENCPNPLDHDFFRYNRKAGDSGMFVNLREVCARIELAPGTYCVIPSSFSPNEDGEFLIRIFSESSNRMKEMDGELDMGQVDETVQKVSEEENAESSEKLQDLFKVTAGEDMEVSWSELKQLLDSYFKKEFNFDGFSNELCRSMVATADISRTGKLGFDEFTDLWLNFLKWKTSFTVYDEDNSGNLSSFELRKALSSAGYLINNKILAALVLRFGDDDGNISFEDFIMICIKLKALLGIYKGKDPEGKNDVKFTLEEWVENTIYC